MSETLTPYATLQDVMDLTGQTYTSEQQDRINQLLAVVSDRLRQYAYNVNTDLDTLISEGKVLTSVVKSVVVDVTTRALATRLDQTPTTNFSQSALGYSVSGTYLVPGGGIFIKNAELRALGLLRQRIGVLEFFDNRDNRYIS